MSLRTVAGVLSSEDSAIPSGTTVVLLEERFGSSFGDMDTPGADEPGEAWSRTTSATPSSTTGPAGGSNQTTRAVENGNGYAFTEGTPSGGGFGPQRTFTMETPSFDATETDEFTLTFDLHMKFGSEGGITEGELFIEGWDGSAWNQISSSIQGSQQITDDAAYLPSTDFGTYDTTGFTNDDFKFRFRFETGDPSNNFDCAVDNIVVTGPDSAIVVVTPSDVRSGFFNTGLRRLHVSQDGAGPLDGTPADLQFTTIQAAVNALRAGDVLTVAAGTYYENVERSNLAGTAAQPVWICAEEPYTAIVSNLIQDVFEGTAGWRDDGSGTYSIAASAAYTAWFGDVFLPQWELADLNGSTFDVEASASESATTLNKPDRGFAFSGNRISIRLPDQLDPNGEEVSITRSFADPLFAFSNCDFVIVDGFQLEGAGDSAAINFDASCTSPETKNNKIIGSQFGVRCVDDTIVDDSEFTLPGHSDFGTDLRTENPSNLNALFRYHKNYNNAAKFKPGSNNSSDALMEGGIDVTIFGGTPPSDVKVRRNYIHSVFEGSKCGRHGSCEIAENVFDECGDDGMELEAVSSTSINGEAHVHSNLFKNCFSTVSHQGDIITDQYVYRNVIEIDDPEVAGFSPFVIKMIKTSSGAQIHWYHNTIINLVEAADSSPGFGTNHWVWFGFSNSTADTIRDFRDNIVIMPNDLDAATVNPEDSRNNVVVSPSDNAASQDVQGTNGVFAGTTEADMDLNADYSPGASSPAIDAASGSLPSGAPADTITTTQALLDAGAFPSDFTVPANWPREQATVFKDEKPERWTSPGGSGV